MSQGEVDPYVKLARDTIEAYVRDGRTVEPPAPLPAELEGRAGVFVSLKKHGVLRGCIGTFRPTQENVAREVIENAIKSATGDPRFPSVKAGELAGLDVSVDVLSEPAPCTPDELDPKRYGVIVEKDWRCGLLLPDLEGVDTVKDQVAIARAKGGIGPQEAVSLYRFTVERHT